MSYLNKLGAKEVGVGFQRRQFVVPNLAALRAFDHLKSRDHLKMREW